MASPRNSTTDRPRVFTFYSYKGGVGRSMALASVAVLLSASKHRVLVIDWDLEAPGIERFFLSGDYAINPEEIRQRSGVTDLAERYTSNRRLDWRECVLEVPVHASQPPVGLITAGRRDDGYVDRVQGIDWEALFIDNGFGTYLETLRQEWLSEFDLVLIDSRTGMTDIGGICTINLPDAIVALFAANYQSVEGIADVARRARQARSRLPFDRGHLSADEPDVMGQDQADPKDLLYGPGEPCFSVCLETRQRN